MKTHIDIDFLKVYLNYQNLTRDTPTLKLVQSGNNSLTITTNYDHRNNITIEFTLKFAHKKMFKTGLLQKTFSIEHHSSGRHNAPHVQIHIHGPFAPDKIGKVWINLGLENESEYMQCIHGFFNLLNEVIKRIEQGAEKSILNIQEVQKLGKDKEFLLKKIAWCLNNKRIEYSDGECNTWILEPKNVSNILEKDAALMPLFSK